MTLLKGCKIYILIPILLLFVCNTLGGRSKLIELDEDNWHEMLEGEWMVEFFAPWCPACKALQPIWKDFATWSNDLGISVGQVDVTASPGLSGRFMVTALPTIFHIKDGVFRQYRGSRDKEGFMSFIEEKKWQVLEEVPAWKSPASYQMSVVSQFFKLSMVLRGFHSTLVEDYGLPTWGSYLVFALATIFIGAMLGLILVCVIDFLFPPKMAALIPIMKSTSAGKNSDEEDLIEDKEEEKEEEEEEKEKEKEKEEDEEKEGEKDQRSEGEGGERSENSEPEANSASASSSPSVRKRRARKAD